MILQIYHQSPGNLTCTMAGGTLRQRHHVAYAHDRVSQLAGDVLEVLQRGNRTHRLTEANLQQLRLAGEELARRLLPSPLLSEIRKSMGSLTLELDAELLWIPWELLYDGEQFLCRRFDMGRLVRTSTPLRAGAKRNAVASPLRLLILTANPADDLPQAEREGMEILTDLDQNPTLMARVLAEPKLEQVRREFKDHDMVHFAGHVDKTEQGWGWRLMDGHLADHEVASMGAGRPMPLLIFSNGCHSGQFTFGQDTGFGPAQAFLTAGVRHYIGTFWELVDGQGAQFARHFYLDLSRGATVGAAVRNARNRVIAESGEAELAWAAYLLYGDPEYAPIPKEPPQQSWSDTDVSLKLGVRATAPYKPKSRKPASEPDESVPSRDGSKINWTVILLGLVTFVSLAAVAILGLLYLRMERIAARPQPTSQSGGQAVSPPRSSESKQPGGKPASGSSQSPTEHGIAAIAISVGSGPPNDRQASDSAALLAACLVERIHGRFPVIQASGQVPPKTARVFIQPRRLKGKLLLTVTVTKNHTLLDSQILSMDKGLDASCKKAADQVIAKLSPKQGP